LLEQNSTTGTNPPALKEYFKAQNCCEPQGKKLAFVLRSTLDLRNNHYLVFNTFDEVIK
jgi:hypothetical protein